MQEGITRETCLVVGVDLGDRYSQVCILDRESGSLVEEGRVRTTAEGLRRRFGSGERMRVALEVGTHSPWVSRLLERLGHEVIVGNARKLNLIFKNRRKSDKVDARSLAGLARVDPRLLSPIRHRKEQPQTDLGVVRSRAALVKARTELVNHVRGAVKSHGHRLRKCSAAAFGKKVGEEIPDRLRVALEPVLETISSLTTQIRALDREVERLGSERYPVVDQLRQVCGVGPLTALTFVLTIGDPSRFPTSRSVGPYLGLVPRTASSGESDPQLRITKEGDMHLRCLLVNAAHYILGPFGQDSDLRRHGMKMTERGGKNARKRAAVAVARKLAVLLHHLWTTGEVYEPLHTNSGSQDAAKPAA